MQLATNTAVRTANFVAAMSYCKYLPTRKRKITIFRASDESLQLGSDVLQAVMHVVRCNKVDEKTKVNAMTITFRDNKYRLIWTNDPQVEIYELKTGNGYILDLKSRELI